MKVIYRLTGIPSTNPSPIYQEDKLKLNRLCLKSFVEAFRYVKPKIYFLVDHADESHCQMIDEVVPFDYEIYRSELGINQTMINSYELATELDDYVLFQECDYIWLPKTGTLFEEALKVLNLVSPYDHRNFYMDKSIHSENTRIKLVEDHHFRTTERNTMTWGTHSSIVRENFDFLVKYGYLDVDVWRDFQFSGYSLWVPLPALATHMVTDYLAPGIDWEAVWKKHQ